jgi:predicted molibdopterin-dependent oxidoreductase YjgC
MPAWEIVARLARLSDAAFEYAGPKAVFEEMTAKVSAMAGAEWGRSARPIQLRFANSRG